MGSIWWLGHLLFAALWVNRGPGLAVAGLIPSITVYNASLYHMMLHAVLESSQWRHNNHNGVSNHQPHGCLLNCLFRHRSEKTSKLRVTGLCAWNSPGPVNSPHKGPVTRKMFPFDDVIMWQHGTWIRHWSYHLSQWWVFLEEIGCGAAECDGIYPNQHIDG